MKRKKVEYDLRIELGKVIDEKYIEIGMRYGKSKEDMEDYIEGLGWWYDGNIIIENVLRDMVDFIVME